MRKLLSVLLLSIFLSIGNTWGTTYKLTQVTNSSDMVAGEKYVFERNAHVLNNTVSSNALQTTATYSTTGLIGNETYVWTLESANYGFRIRSVAREGTNPFLHNSYETNKISFITSTNDASLWNFTFTNGVVLIKNASNLNRFLGEYTSGSNTYVAFTNNNGNLNSQGHDFTVYKLEAEPEYTLHEALALAATDGTGTYWATFSDATNVTFFPSTHDTGHTTTVYTVYVTNGVMTLSALTPQDVTIRNETVNGCFIPANTGVLIKSTSASTPYYTVANVPVSALSDNLLYPGTGSTIDSPTPTSNYYFLLLGYTDFNVKSTLGFYLQNQAGDVFTSRLGGAYLAVPKATATAAAGYRILNEEDNATRIESFHANEFIQKYFENGQLMIRRDEHIYDILGRRIN